MRLCLCHEIKCVSTFMCFLKVLISAYIKDTHTHTLYLLSSLSFTFTLLLLLSLSPSCPSSSCLLSPSLSLLNHDCRPNCVMVFERTKLQLRAVRDINPEEEVWDSSQWHQFYWLWYCHCFYDHVLNVQYLSNDFYLLLLLMKEPIPEAVLRYNITVVIAWILLFK